MFDLMILNKADQLSPSEQQEIYRLLMNVYSLEDIMKAYRHRCSLYFYIPYMFV